MLKAICMGVAAIAISTAAHAQMHMCKDAQGRKTYSDAPCGTDDTIVNVTPSTGGPRILPNESVKVEYYDIRGATWDVLARDIQAKGPEEGWAHAGTKFSYKYMTRKTAKGCVIDTVVMSVDSTIRLPNWVDRYNGAPSLQTWWDGALRNIDMHERGHVQISLDAARETERMLKTLPEQPTCDALNEIAANRAQRILTDQDLRQTEYDAKTDRGQRGFNPYRN